MYLPFYSIVGVALFFKKSFSVGSQEGIFSLNILFIMGRAELFLLLNKKSENENGDGIPVDGNLVG